MKVIRQVFFWVLGMIREADGKLSIGRLLLLSCFGLAVYKWFNNIDITSSHLTILVALLGYVLSGKVIENVKDGLAKVAEIKKTAQEIVGKKEEEE